MQTAIQAVLFDYGQVLSLPPNQQAWQRMQSLLSLDEVGFSALYWQFRDDYDKGVLNSDTYWQAIADACGVTLTPELLLELEDADVAVWTDLNPDSVAWVQRLQAAGVRTGLLSNIGDAMVRGIRDRFDWIGRMHFRLFSHELGLRKPEPEIYEAAVQGMGVPASEILFVDDRLENIEAAHRAGMHAVHFTNWGEFEARLHREGYGWLLQG